jgi:uncharacterized NAD(P)/FAD-binding protein YdhS
MSKPVVAIVGAGFSGVLTALSILETPGSRTRVRLIEQAERFGVGAAFGDVQPDHLLNVRAMNMSADPDQPDDFAQWLGRRREGPPEPFAFASRAEYGAYIQERLRHVAQSRAAAERLDLVQDTVAAIRKSDDGFELELAMGRGLHADRVVLATGNAPPSRAVLPDPAFAGHGFYVGDPWKPEALDAVAPDDPILLLGSGLTIVDVMATLDARGHQAEVTALSRHGLRPHRHARANPHPTTWRRAPGESLSDSLGRFRRDAARAGDWRGLFDTLRADTQAHWKALSLAERRRFLRCLRPWWDIHRHRLAPAMADRLDEWLASRLRIEAGRLGALTDRGGQIEAVWTPRGARTLERRRVRWVINCTGPEGDPRESLSPLIRGLMQSGLVRSDPLGLGMNTTEDGRLIGADGEVHADLFAIGPAARGALWEVTAVPDIRVQARRLGRVLGRSRASPSRASAPAATG